MLTTNNLQCGYKNHGVLKGLNLQINDQEIFCLIGPNGSGKTTLLKTLFGLLPPLSGEIRFNNQLIENLSLQERSRFITMQEADPLAPFSITVEELFSIRKTKESKERRDLLFKHFDLYDLFKKDILTLSAGQAKRAWLAHTFSLESQVIIMDEPFLHLDWIHQQKLMETFKIWKKTFATTFVLALHEFSLLANLADRLCVLSDSAMTALGTPEVVLTSKTITDFFQFTAIIDVNPIDGSKRVTLGKKNE